MGTVTPLRDVMTKEIRETFTSIEKVLTTEKIRDIVCIMRNEDGSDIFTYGVVKDRWLMIGFIEEMKHWLLED